MCVLAQAAAIQQGEASGKEGRVGKVDGIRTKERPKDSESASKIK